LLSCLETAEKTRREVVDILKAVVPNDHLLEAIIVEVEGKVDIGGDWLTPTVPYGVVLNLDLGVWGTGTLEGHMLEVD
jgi:hypothetical protein